MATMMAEQRLHAFGNDALGADDVVGLRERLERREVSPAELLAAARSRAAHAWQRTASAT